ALSGWYTLRSELADAAYYATELAELDDDTRRTFLQHRVEAFIPGAEVIDVDYKVPAGSVTEYAVRAYFVRHGHASSRFTVPFPYPESWFPKLSGKAERPWNYSAVRRTE